MSEQVIADFKRTKLVDVLNGNSGGDKNAKAPNSGAIKDGSSTMSVGQKARFDTTPVDPKGNEYPGNDPTLNSPAGYKADGTSPIVEWSLLVDGKEVMNTDDNPFEMGSAEDNAGCTPTLKLLRQIGGGRHRCEFGPFVNASNDYNGGVAVPCNSRAVFYAD